MRKRSRLYWVVLAAVFFAAVGLLWSKIYWEGLQGAWVDRAASDSISRLAGFRVTMLDVKIRRWFKVDFNAAHAGTSQKTWAASGRGRISFDSWEWWKKDGIQRIYLRLDDVALMESLYRQSSLIAWAFGQAFEDPIFAERVKMVLSRRQGVSRIHLLEFDSKEMTLSGGFQLRAGRVLKANLIVLLPEHKFEKIPKEIRARMLRRGDRRGVRLIYSQGQLTASGSSGPFFKAQWR